MCKGLSMPWELRSLMWSLIWSFSMTKLAFLKYRYDLLSPAEWNGATGNKVPCSRTQHTAGNWTPNCETDALTYKSSLVARKTGILCSWNPSYILQGWLWIKALLQVSHWVLEQETLLYLILSLCNNSVWFGSTVGENIIVRMSAYHFNIGEEMASVYLRK